MLQRPDIRCVDKTKTVFFTLVDTTTVRFSYQRKTTKQYSVCKYVSTAAVNELK